MAHFTHDYLRDTEGVRKQLISIVERYLQENFPDLYNKETKEWSSKYVANWYRWLPFTPGEKGYYRALSFLKYLKDDHSSREMLKYFFNNSGWNRLFTKFIESVYPKIVANKQCGQHNLRSFYKTPSQILVAIEEEKSTKVKQAIEKSLAPVELTTLSNDAHSKQQATIVR